VLRAQVCAILRHDSPAFARFRSNQGMVTTVVGVPGVLFLRTTIFALCGFGLGLASRHNWDLSCIAGFTLLLGLPSTARQRSPQILHPFIVVPTIGLRKPVRMRPTHRTIV
jgi:hypothetical protein